jgi:hypothetical protein
VLLQVDVIDPSHIIKVPAIVSLCCTSLPTIWWARMTANRQSRSLRPSDTWASGFRNSTRPTPKAPHALLIGDCTPLPALWKLDLVVSGRGDV